MISAYDPEKCSIEEVLLDADSAGEKLYDVAKAIQHSLKKL